MLVSALLSVALSVSAADAVKPFEFKDGDRIVWLGNTLVEREQRYGYWETALLAANANKTITVRNLGWSGDTVYGDARAGFDNAAKGYERMVSLALELKPTVIFVNFGANEAFEGKEGLPKFEKGLEKLLDSLKPANARIVLFTPIPINTLESPLSATDAKIRNETIRLYDESIKGVAKKREHYLADLGAFVELVFNSQKRYLQGNPKLTESHAPLTTNGVHLSGEGYSLATVAFQGCLGLSISLEENAAKYAPLRKAVIAKNEQFFNKWRPQNETYLFGFRKHEQGKNAKEIAEFDPFIAKDEDEIAKLRKGLK